VGVTDEFRIVRGVPTDEELAAIVGVLLSRRPAPTPDPVVVSRWAESARPSYAYRDGRPTRPDRTAWSASGLPR
jgi:Acyl-CoA carboxylase epsilon subunit